MQADSLGYGQWGRMRSQSGVPTGFVRKCYCGTSYPFPDQLILSQLKEGRRPRCGNKECARQHGDWDFAGAVMLAVPSASKDNPSFKTLLDRFEGDIVAEDFAKYPDGRFWLRADKWETLFSKLPQVPDTTVPTEGSGGPILMPTDGPVFKIEWSGTKQGGTDSDPFAGGPGFSMTRNRKTEYEDLPRWFKEKREAAMLRHLRAYGTANEVRAYEKELEGRGKERAEAEKRAIELHESEIRGE